VIKDFSRGPLAIFAVAMRPMRLLVMRCHPPLMFQFRLFPARHLGKIEISQTALQIEIRLKSGSEHIYTHNVHII
jgi:hypothetical protein